ncbi:thiol-disulfide isomerase-like thioredoxin [Mycolicibacterium tokaiense]|uniref:Thiol-disulfide isomerase-like thioredoxin n=1 Tax=Mycolicibacterium tokaiense TaxID=39695 RepID=A0A379PLT4_9MYCO|nr:thiol-disulfide isomerase-like thioredoxin [Mycolicibacterium tokaiense]
MQSATTWSSKGIFVPSLRRCIAVVAAVVVAAASVTGCTTGEDAVAQGGTFDFVSPGGQTAIFYDPPSTRGTIGDLTGPDLFTDEPIQLSDSPARSS